MDKQEDLFHPLGMCQKVFKFIARLFSSQSGGRTAHHQTDQGSSIDEGSALQVHFKQSEDPLQNLDSCSSILIESAENTKIHEPITNQTQVRSRRAAHPASPKKHTTKSAVSVKHPSQENKTEDEKITVPIDTKKPKLKYQPHLISVAPNINEKSESFIKTRIEAMRRNFGLDPHDS